MDRNIDRYKSQKRVKSPRRQALTKQLDQHTNRIKQLMYQDYILLQEENAQLKLKCIKVNELQDKVELVLKHNENLFLENQKLSKLVESKIEECQILKRKIQANRRSNQEIIDYEKKKFTLQLQKFQKQIEEVELLKNNTIKQLKTKHQTQLDKIKSENEEGIKLYDEQLIKLKQILDKKQIDLNLIQAKYKRLQTDCQFQIAQLKQDKSKLKDQIKKLQPFVNLYENSRTEHSKLIQTKKQDDVNNQNQIKQLIQKNKVNLINNQNQIKQLIQKNKVNLINIKNESNLQIQDLKKQWKQRQQIVQQQKNILELKITKQSNYIQDLQQKIRKLQKLKQQLQINEQKLRKQIEILRNQIKQLTIINDKQVQSLQQKFESLTKQQIIQISLAHEQHQKYIQKQIQKLSQIIRLKQNQIIYLSQEKARIKQRLMDDGSQLKNQLILLQNQFRQNQILHREQLNKLQQNYIIKIRNMEQQLLNKIIKQQNQAYNKLKKLEQNSSAKYKKLQIQSTAHVKRLQSQIINIDKDKRKYLEELNKKSTQVIAYKQIVDSQKDQIKQITKRAEEKQKALKKSQQEWKKNSIDLKNRLDKLQQSYEKQKEQNKRILQEKILSYETIIKQKIKTIQNLQKQNQSIKDFVNNRDKNLFKLNQNITELNKVIKDRELIIDSLREQIVTQFQKHSQRSALDKKKLEQSYQDKIKYLIQNYKTKIQILQNKISELKILLKQKQNNLEQILKQYLKMKNQIIVLSQQEANKKQITLKFPGPTADLIATKNMFDVFIKSKLLQVCSEVVVDELGAQNAKPKSK